MNLATELPHGQFDNVIRFIKLSTFERARMIQRTTESTLGRLEVGRDPSKAVKGLPDGSDEGNVRNVLLWLGLVEGKNKEVAALSKEEKATKESKAAIRSLRNAIAQVVAIDATATARMDV